MTTVMPNGNLTTIGSSNASTTYLLTPSATTEGAAPTIAGRVVNKIAPKRQRQDSEVLSESPQNARNKRRQLHQGRGSAPPAVARRNERERNRVRQVNLGFATLRQHVPNGAKSKKMSKVETLRSAVQYIKQLQQLLSETGMDDENSFPALEDPMHHHQPQAGHHHHQAAVTSPPCSAASSPTPSLGSDASSPYDSLSPEDEELLDFTTWLS